MIVAEITAEGLVLIITATFAALGTFVMQIIHVVLAYRERQAVALRDEQTKRMLAENTRATVSGVHKMDSVLIATNGLKDELVREVRKSSFAEGVKCEADKSGILKQKGG